MRHFQFRKTRESFLEWLFLPKQEIIINYQGTLLSLIGLKKGYKTRVVSEEQLVLEGEARKIVEILSEEGSRRGVPLALPIRGLSELRDYELRIPGYWVPIRRIMLMLEHAKFSYNPDYEDGDRKDPKKLLENYREVLRDRIATSRLADGEDFETYCDRRFVKSIKHLVQLF